MLVDIECQQEYRAWQFGCVALICVRCMLVLLLLGELVCALAVAPVDDPETAFDETDLPANVACLRVHFGNTMLSGARGDQ
jgi:hypothetical protein